MWPLLLAGLVGVAIYELTKKPAAPAATTATVTAPTQQTPGTVNLNSPLPTLPAIAQTLGLQIPSQQTVASMNGENGLVYSSPSSKALDPVTGKPVT